MPQLHEITTFPGGLLDQGGLGGYLHPLAMVGHLGHNWSVRTSTMFDMDSDFVTRPWMIEPTNPLFPKRFSDLPVPPRGLWVDGRPPLDSEPLLAIVGSRAATRAASNRVTQIAAELAGAGWAVVSGGALGIDAAAHRGVLEAGGTTFAVLGCGIDVVYPDRHARLFCEIAAAGGLLSEYGPGVSPRPGQFPARNRLVAALARVLIVAESRRASGALITARQASALGRPVFAIPGSAGTDGLLAAGAARAVETAADVLDALAGRASPAPVVPIAFKNILTALGDGPASADAIAHRAGMTLAETLAALFEAELGGFVARVPGGRFEAPRGH